MSWPVRIGTLLFSAVFAAGFGAGGFFVGLLPLYQTLSAAWEVRSWQSVPAQVLETQLDRRRDSEGSETYAVRVRYRYQVGAQTYESQRVGLDAQGHSDNVGDWHAQWHRRLQAAQSSGQALTAWVNPREPAQALLDPHIRWPMLLFRLPFALVFTAVGLAAAWFFFKALRGSSGQATPAADAAAGLQRMGRSVRQSAGMLWFFALFWCGLSFPIAALFWMQEGPWFVKIFLLLFVLVGLGLIAWAGQQTRLAWRHAHTALALRPATPRAGEPLEVTLNLPERALRGRAPEPLVLRLAQYRVDDSGSGETRRLVEHLEQQAQPLPLPDGSARLVARFTLPDDAPAHGARRSGERVDWRLELMQADTTRALNSLGGQVEAMKRQLDQANESQRTVSRIREEMERLSKRADKLEQTAKELNGNMREMASQRVVAIDGTVVSAPHRREKKAWNGLPGWKRSISSSATS